jgi:hypothetical protein
MKKTFVIFAAAAFVLASVATGRAQLKKVAQTGMQFMKVDVSARAAAMGGAYTMVGHDASALLYNAAGMTATENVDFYVARTEWIGGISYNAAGIIMTHGNLGTFGLSARNSDYGEVIGTRVAENQQGFEETGELNVGAYAVGFSYARDLSTRFSVGGQVKYAAQHLGSNLVPGGEISENRVSTLAYDFGTKYYPGLGSLRLGMSLRNFSPQIRYVDQTFELPLTFRIGMAADVFDFVGDTPSSSLLVSMDALHPRDYTERLHFGAEYGFRDLFALRGGYKVNYDEESFSLGFGVTPEFGGVRMKLDYSYSALDRFDDVNRVTLGASF